MLPSFALLFILSLYLILLFVVAHWAEKKSASKWVNNPYVYTLSLAVYCSAWTYYGSVGVAAEQGLSYLTIYLGPIIIIPAWIVILKKIIRISRIHKISSIADFISLRYGNHRFLGAFITLILILGILPYISLQLKAISETFQVVTGAEKGPNIFFDTTTYIAIALALFASFYGTRYVDASEKRKGIIAAVALESVLKLFFFILVGVYVTFFVFNGFEDIYAQASMLKGFQQKNSIGGIPQALNWAFMCVLSMCAIFLLPRQFHTSIVENVRENHVNTAVWLFPLYLLLFNIFVYPIAWGGNVLFEQSPVNADLYALMIPILEDNPWITVAVFLGGFSAAISMIVVSSLALSIMLSNNVLIPYGFVGSLKKEDQSFDAKKIIQTRKVSIFLIIIFSFFIYRFLVLDYSLVSIGLVSFVVIAQLAPSFFGALFWKRGSHLGAISGLVAGFIIACYTLLIPYALGVSDSTNTFVNEGPWGIIWLKPTSLFGLDYLTPINHALFWSLFANLIIFAWISVQFKSDYRERNYAEMYVEVNQYISNHEDAFVWKGTAYIKDIEKVLIRFLGKDKTKRALDIFRLKYNVSNDVTTADARLIKFSENLLTGHIGTASARILLAGVTKEEKISLPEVLQILEESKKNLQINKTLRETSEELKQLSAQLKLANLALIEKDKQKDEFLDTVTHELRTPITAIRAASEILIEDEELPNELKNQFLQNIISESDRLNRLIDKILDLEKFETGKQKLHFSEYFFEDTINKAIDPLKHLMDMNKITLILEAPKSKLKAVYDEERMIQVINNLISNAIKFAKKDTGLIIVRWFTLHEKHVLQVYNNGLEIDKADLNAIFDKFYQSQNQNFKKPIGSGLGLAICKQIMEAHRGTISAQNLTDGVEFNCEWPSKLE